MGVFKMFKNINSFYPNDIFPKLNFAKIKHDLKDLSLWQDSSLIEDFGSILIIENDSYYVTINNIGKIKIGYDCIDKTCIDEIVDNIEVIFKEQAQSFNIKDKTIINKKHS